MGDLRPLPPSVDQAAYRILQEALTNAARHGTGRAELEITYRARQLELAISNRMPAVAVTEPTESGHGILGMRERAALLGGSVEARSRNGRFHVYARLPYSPSDEQ